MLLVAERNTQVRLAAEHKTGILSESVDCDDGVLGKIVVSKNILNNCMMFFFHYLDYHSA